MPGPKSALTRRAFLTAGASCLAFASAADASPSGIRAIAFDAFPIFDPRSLKALCEKTVGSEGANFFSQWTTRLFSYTWLETAAEHYESFHDTAYNSLRSTELTLNLSLTEADREQLVSHFDELEVWSDVVPALEQLRQHGIRMRLLSNLSIATLNRNTERNNLTTYFEPPLSTDSVSHFKPSPIAYEMALSAFQLPKEQIGFVAFGGWDAVGATWFGYRTAWINRLNVPLDQLGPTPAIVDQGIKGALTLAGIA